MTSRAKVVKVESWDELPDVLERGTYVIGGRRLVLYERMPKRAAKRLVKIAKGGREEYV